ncbi:MAG TPA: hypothetical protein VMH39_07235, partial [Gemmatimonadaceae bacterium]|nr:hypothetical protein [Gemmatimonadaceae bacterium]
MSRTALVIAALVARFGPGSPAMVEDFGYAPRDTAAVERATVERLRSEETAFILTWRRVWEQTFNGIRPVQARLTAAHCHPDFSYQGGSPHLIHPDSSPNLKAWCPIWDIDTTPPRGDARLGIDYALPLYAENILRKQRAVVLHHLDSAAAMFPADAWIAGQRVRMYVDQRMFPEAIGAAHDCRTGMAWCAMLTGYASYQAGDVAAADSAFARGLRAMPFSDRCKWSDISPLLSQPERTTYMQLSCAERATLDERFWWLANPLMSETGNERRADQISREVLVALHSALTVDEWTDWRPQFGRVVTTELLLRYGRPSYSAWPDSMEDAEHFTWMGFSDSSVNTTAEYLGPRFHTAPPWHAITDPMSLTVADWAGLSPTYDRGKWQLDSWPWPQEFYARDAGPLVPLDNQTAVLRRDKSTLVVVATQMPSAFVSVSESPPYVGTLVLSSGPRDTTHFPHRGIDITKTAVLAGYATEPVIASAELVPAGNAVGQAGRTRFALTPPAPLAELRPGEMAISDLVLFQPPPSDDSMPMSAVGALPRMLGTT